MEPNRIADSNLGAMLCGFRKLRIGTSHQGRYQYLSRYLLYLYGIDLPIYFITLEMGQISSCFNSGIESDFPERKAVFSIVP